MDQVTYETIEQLSNHNAGLCISLYLPTHRAGRETQQGPIHLKNRIAEAESQLKELGIQETEIRKLCQPAKRLCVDGAEHADLDFWQHQSDGLAMFLGPNIEKKFRVPERFDELTVVAGQFHIKPLIRAAQHDGQYRVLAVSKKGVHFLEGSRNGLAERHIEDLPKSLQDILGESREKGFSLHSFNIVPRQGDSAVPHGYVDAKQLRDVERYLRAIDRALHDELKDSKIPLVFAGVEELFAVFKEQCDYNHLVEKCVAGSPPEEINEAHLHKQAWPLVEPILNAPLKEAIEQIGTGKGSGLASEDLEEILIAAHDGRVAKLLLDNDRRQWGTYDHEQRKMALAEKPTAENYDLYDRAAVKTLLSSGRVFVVDDHDTLAKTGIAAVYRYSLED